MEKKIRVGLRMVLLLMSFCFSGSVFAETITLKSGAKIEAKIIEGTDQYIKIDFQGNIVTYSMDEIKSIGEEAPVLPSAEDKVPSKEQLTYKSPYFNFIINYPANWEVREISGIVGFASPRESALDNFQENVNVMVEDLSSNPISLKEYYGVSLMRANAVPDFKLTEEGNTEIGGNEALFLLYLIKGMVKLKCKAFVFITNSKAYTLTYTAEEETFDKYLPQAEGIMKSIRTE